MAKQKSSRKIRPQRSSDRSEEPQSDPSPTPVSDPAAIPETLTPGTLIPLLALLVIIGTWGFLSGHATIKGNEMSKYQALFSAANAATLTGFQQARNPNDYTLFGQLLTLVLMLAGIFFSFVAGGIAVIRIARMRFGYRQLVTWAFASTLLMALLGGVALHGPDRNFFQAGYEAVSAYGNCGLHLGTLPDGTGASVQLILLPLAMLGGFGLPVLMEIVDWFRGRRPMSDHSRTVLLWSAGAYAVLTVVMVLLRAPWGNASGPAWQHTIAGASREAINARSAGFSFESASYLPQTAATVLILAMLVGAAPGGTAGGLKLTTLATLWAGTRDLLARRSIGRPLGIASLWTGIYLTIVLLVTLALMVTDPEFHLDRTLFMAVSALGNVGLSHDPIVASDAGLCVLSVTMLLGRVAPVLMLWYTMRSTPEATIAVG